MREHVDLEVALLAEPLVASGNVAAIAPVVRVVAECMALQAALMRKALAASGVLVMRQYEHGHMIAQRKSEVPRRRMARRSCACTCGT